MSLAACELCKCVNPIARERLYASLHEISFPSLRRVLTQYKSIVICLNCHSLYNKTL